MRLLFFARERYPTYRGRISILFGRELPRRGYSVDLVAQAGESQTKSGLVVQDGMRVWIGATVAGQSLTAKLVRAFHGLRHDLRFLICASRTRYDAVLISDKFLLATIALGLSRLRGIPVFFWLTFPYPESLFWRAADKTEKHRWLLRLRAHVTAFFLYRWILPRSDRLFVQSPRMGDRLRERVPQIAESTPILTGVDLADFPAVKDYRAVRKRQRFTVAYLGTLVRERRLTVLVDMLSLLVADGYDVGLVLVGDGEHPSDTDEIRAAARAGGVLDRVEITGFLAREQALARVIEADVGISPFFPNEILDVASPTKLIEYLALGIPVIANDHPEQSVVIAESRAGLCTPWGSRYFARAVRWMIASTVERRASLGACGRKWLESKRTYTHIAGQIDMSLSKACR